MKAIPPWVIFSILRLVVFLVPFGVLMITGVPWWLSTILAAIIGLCVSYIFLRTPRERLSAEIDERRRRKHAGDDEPEAP